MFNIGMIQKEGWQIVVLKDKVSGMQVEVVPSAGAILNAYILPSGFNVIDGYSGLKDFHLRVHKGFRSAKLSPFVCRLNKSKYTWQGKEYRIEKFELNGSAIHGILYDAPFAVTKQVANEEYASVTLAYVYAGQQQGYPFPYVCGITYTLRKDGELCIHTRITNTNHNSKAIPVCDGWHPYFRLGGKVDEWTLTISSDQMMEYNEELIPTGRYVRNGRYLNGRKLGMDQLDNGFLLREGVSPYCILENMRIRIEFLAQKHYPYLQLYIPDQRDSIAIENLSAAPDAFNNGMGLTSLTAGDHIDYETVIRLTEKEVK